MDNKQQELKDELKKKQAEREIENRIKKGEKAAEEFVRKIVKKDDFKFECHHQTNLKYDFENNKERFIKTLSRGLLMNFLREIPLDEELLVDTDGYCFDCGKWLRYKLSNNILSTATFDDKFNLVNDNSECFKVDAFSVEIAVPSGKLILVDWPVHGKETLSYLDEDENGDTESINSAKGRFLRSNKYAKENIMHFCVGNTSPSVYHKDNVVYIGRNGYDEDDDEIPFAEDAECVGSVCTDLWWVTAFDYEIYKKMVIEKVGEQNELDSEYGKTGWGVAQVNVKPGIYKCTHYYETLDRDSSEPQLYSKMEWVRKL